MIKELCQAASFSEYLDQKKSRQENNQKSAQQTTRDGKGGKIQKSTKLQGGTESNADLWVIGALFDSHIQGVVLQIECPDLIFGAQRMKIDGRQGFIEAIDNGDTLYRDDAGREVKTKIVYGFAGQGELMGVKLKITPYFAGDRFALRKALARVIK
ncbi:MAG: hypothetical protein C0403_15420 [Desulfobacterium sp.]|nr:hypothetical protein [Desulfobacterium sp.]